MTLPDPVFPKASGGVMAEGKEASCERGSGAEVVHTSAKGADRRDEIQEIPMTKAELVAELVAALRQIDALDPEDGIHAFSKAAMAGLVMRMGMIARHAIAKAEAASAGETKCACGAMSEQDCHDLPSLRHCGGAEATSAAERSNDPLGTLKCQHKECGRFWDVRAWSCRAMADNACARHDAPTPAPVSVEREELAKWCDDRKANCRAHGDVFGFDTYEKIATALRTPHELPGEDM